MRNTQKKSREKYVYLTEIQTKTRWVESFFNTFVWTLVTEIFIYAFINILVFYDRTLTSLDAIVLIVLICNALFIAAVLNELMGNNEEVTIEKQTHKYKIEKGGDLK